MTTDAPAAQGLQQFCFACGNAIDPRAEICPRCGVRQQTVATNAGKDRIAAAAFAILLGSFGAHKFYLGKIAQGVIYLIFCWTYIPGLVGWVEGMLYLHTSDVDWATAHGGPVRAANSAAVAILWVVALLPLLAILAIIALIFLGSQVSSVTPA